MGQDIEVVSGFCQCEFGELRWKERRSELEIERRADLSAPQRYGLGFPFGFWPLYMGYGYYGNNEVSLRSSC